VAWRKFASGSICALSNFDDVALKLIARILNAHSDIDATLMHFEPVVLIDVVQKCVKVLEMHLANGVNSPHFIQELDRLTVPLSGGIELSNLLATFYRKLPPVRWIVKERIQSHIGVLAKKYPRNLNTPLLVVWECLN
jgi:hypothetical protein